MWLSAKARRETTTDSVRKDNNEDTSSEKDVASCYSAQLLISPRVHWSQNPGRLRKKNEKQTNKRKQNGRGNHNPTELA